MYVAKIIEVSYARLHLHEVFVQCTSQRLMYCICIYLQTVVNTIWLFLNNPECVLSKRSTDKFAADIATGNINAYTDES